MQTIKPIFLSFMLATIVLDSAAQDGLDVVTYQGRLTSSTVPINDICDFEFQVWNAENEGAPLSSLQSLDDVSVVDGEFTVMIDFQSGVFVGGEAWYEIATRCPAGSGNFTMLSPRQPVTTAPKASTLEIPALMNGSAPGQGAINIENTSGADDSFAIRAFSGNSSDTSAAIFAENYSAGGGRAIWGSHNGSGVGILGTSVNGQGVRATSESGTGLFAESETGNAIFAIANDFGEYAVYGLHDGVGVAGSAILGDATSATGEGIGVIGRANASPDGIGVYGFHGATTGTGPGVRGESLSTSANGKAVYGLMSSLSNPGSFSSAVRGEHRSFGSNGIGVWGSQDGGGWGVYGTSPGGRGVYGYATGSPGVNYGVYGRTESASGFSFFAAGPGTDYGSSSSVRWKRNIKPIDNALGRLVQLNGVFFDWDEDHGGHRDVGMIAEEVGKVLPEVVQYEENGVDAIGMDYSRMTPLLVEAVKALKQENKALQDRLAALESRLAQTEEFNKVAQLDPE